MTLVSAGRVGRAHGLDGSFYVVDPQADFAVGATLHLGGREYEIARRAGTASQPLIRLAGIDEREAVAAIHGQMLLVDAAEAPIEEDEYLVADLVGCEVPGLGYVERVLDAPSCALLEVGHDRHLIPLIGDAVKRVDLEAKTIEVDRDFLGY